MRRDKNGFPHTLRLSGVLLVMGLCTEAGSLFWVHPIAFIVFFVVGGALLGAGVLLFLYPLVLLSSSPDSHDSEARETLRRPNSQA